MFAVHFIQHEEDQMKVSMEPYACVSCSVCPTLCDPMACSPPVSMRFSREEYWSGLPFLSPRDLPDPGIKPRSPALQADSLPSFITREALSDLESVA